MASECKIDLLNGSNKRFLATFDMYTPRPHFIFLCTGDVSKSDYQQLDSNEKLKLMRAVDDLCSRFDLRDGILSVHRGSWVSDHNIFHIHLCVDVEKYLAVFKSSGVTSPKYVTKEWRKNKNPANYADNVRGYPYKCYHADDVKEVTKYKSNDFMVHDRLKHGQTWGTPSMIVVFHRSLPRIGFKFVHHQNTQTLECKVQVLDLIDWFAAKHEMTVAQKTADSSKGCHVCLLTGPNSNKKVFPDDKDVVGYIEMSALKFYRMCPAEMADEWFDKYSGETGYSPLT